jgi:hypothetical protein
LEIGDDTFAYSGVSSQRITITTTNPKGKKRLSKHVRSMEVEES